MSTRYTRTADKALNDKHTLIFNTLCQETDNKLCADCKRKDPRWASWNLGVFICIRCSGVHRSLGVHISKVKSVDLDTWLPDQVEHMQKWGNLRANSYWEANLANQPHYAKDLNNMDPWIRLKYEQKRWVLTESVPDPDNVPIIKSSPPPPPQETKPAPPIASMYHHLHSQPVKEASSTPSPIRPPSSNPTTDKSYANNLADFQQQLYGLSKGLPSTGIIPPAPSKYQNMWPASSTVQPK